MPKVTVVSCQIWPHMHSLQHIVPPFEEKMDEIDHRILRELQRNGRLSNAELAERVNLSPSPCLRRLRKL